MVLARLRSEAPEITEKNEFYPGLDKSPVPYKTFLPAKPPKSLIILYPGASPTAENHPQVKVLGCALASAGFLVLIPRIPPLKELRISHEITEWYCHFYAWMKTQPEWRELPGGLIGLSFGGLSVLKALLTPEMQKQPPKSILAYGTTYDFFNMAEFLFSGKIHEGGRTITISPDPWGIVILFYNYLSRIDAGYDTSRILRVLEAVVREDEAEAERLKSSLSQDELDTVIAIQNGQRTNEVRRLFDQIKYSCKAEIDSFSPRNWCKDIQQRVYVLHGTSDRLSPYTESILLAENLPHSRLLISRILEHRSLAGLWSQPAEFVRIVRFLSDFIRYTES